MIYNNARVLWSEWMIIHCSCVCEKCAAMMEELFSYVANKINKKILIYLIFLLFTLTPGLETSWWSLRRFTWWSQLTLVIGSAVGRTFGKWFLSFQTDILTLILLLSFLAPRERTNEVSYVTKCTDGIGLFKI